MESEIVTQATELDEITMAETAIENMATGGAEGVTTMAGGDTVVNGHLEESGGETKATGDGKKGGGRGQEKEIPSERKRDVGLIDHRLMTEEVAPLFNLLSF